MPRIPHDEAIDSTTALRRDPYRFIQDRCRRLGADVFEARIGLRPTLFASGPAAAALFYDETRFVRHGAMPEPVRATLIGKGGVQGLDGAAHRHRKQLFLSLMPPERVAHLGELVAARWGDAARGWTARRQVVLYDELQVILTRSVCEWAGVPLAEAEVGRRARQLTALFDAAADVGLGHLRSRLARKRAERWLAGLIERVRGDSLAVPEGSAARAIALHRDLDGRLLPPRIAAVELLNVLRPTVAVAVYITFVAHALHAYPEGRARLAADGEAYADLFVQEVRRFYPFFPSIAARVRHSFEWRGVRFPRGRRVMLDLFGTDRDPRTWEEPDAFRPERFGRSNGGLFGFVPQGGGEHAVHHRCPGEWITLELMRVAVRFLTETIDYDVPTQDLRIDWSRLPALPRSRFVLADVRRRRA